MARRDADDHRRLADRDPSESVPEHDPLRAEPAAGPAVEPRKGRQRESSMGLVLERDHATAAPSVGSHPSGEHDHSAQLVPRQLAHGGRDR